MPKVIPFGDRIMVIRKKIGRTAGKLGLIEVPDTTADKATDLATVTFIPDHTFADKELIDNGNEIIKNLADKAKNGDVEALKSLITFNTYLKHKSIKPGDEVMISKYIGTDFHDNKNPDVTQTLVSVDDIIGLICNE